MKKVLFILLLTVSFTIFPQPRPKFTGLLVGYAYLKRYSPIDDMDRLERYIVVLSTLKNMDCDEFSKLVDKLTLEYHSFDTISEFINDKEWRDRIPKSEVERYYKLKEKFNDGFLLYVKTIDCHEKTLDYGNEVIIEY